jgi:hypothetical protein
MPYEPHANLIQPEDNNAYIWRFIDLPEFLDMLVTGSLYFTRERNPNPNRALAHQS